MPFFHELLEVFSGIPMKGNLRDLAGADGLVLNPGAHIDPSEQADVCVPFCPCPAL